MSQRFQDKVVIVTGGSRGIGLAIVQRFADEGAQVVIAARDQTRGQQVAQALRQQGAPVDFIGVDVAQRDQAEALIAQVIERFGRLDVLVNNAGAHEKAPFADESEDLWQRMFRINVLGTVFPSQAAVRHMRAHEGGSIVHVASKAGVVGEPGRAAYSAAKGAVIALTRAMAVELARDGIRVNAVCPGPVVTDMLLEAVPTEEQRRQLAAQAPLGRLGQPLDIAGAVLFLASDESAWCTGQALSVDGGLSVLL
ncbi:MAG: SDR family NAD(P)-dependent oxidoreductase [Aggregatilineaceae bacterium]